MQPKVTRESAIEKHLQYRVELAGGLCWKWASPGRRGVPDRIVLWPRGAVSFVELKAPGGRLSPLQKWTHARMHDLCHDVAVLASIAEVDEWVDTALARLEEVRRACS